MSSGTSAPVYMSTGSIYVGKATNATNLDGGAGGSIPYQTAANATGFIAIGTAGHFVTSNGSVPSWSTYAPAQAVTPSDLNSVYSKDTRATDYTPGQRNAGLYVDFRQNSANGLSDGGTYNGVLTFRSYGAANDLSGGQVQQIAYTDNNNLWHRISTNTSTWGAWVKILDTANVGSITAGGSSQVATTARPNAGAHYITFVDSNNATATAETVYTTSSFTINPATGAVGINTASPNQTFEVNAASPGIRLQETSAGQKRLDLTVDSSGIATVAAPQSAQILRLSTVGTVGLTVDASQNVYLGTGSTQLNTGFTNKLNVSGVIVAGNATSTNGSTLMQGYYGTGALTVIGTDYSTGGPVVGYGVTPSSTTSSNFLSSSGIAGLTRSATVWADSVKFLTAPGTTTAIGGQLAMVERMRLTNNGGLSFGASGTAFGSAGQILQSNGDAAPTWVTPSGLAAGSSSQVQTTAQTASASYYPTFVDSNNASATAETVYTTSSFAINAQTGAVGIGGGLDSTWSLAVKAPGTLGGTAGNFQKVYTSQAPGGSGGNNVYVSEWRRRRATGTDWTTHNVHNGIWVDASFTTPGTDTRTWWERDPNTPTQSWGDQATTWMFANSTGLGLGTTTLLSGARLTVNGGANISGIITGTSYVRLGSNTFTKAIPSAGEIQFDNGTNDTPGISFYYGNSVNFGMDCAQIASTATLRFVRHINETGGTVLGHIDLSGNLNMIGDVTAYYSDRRLKTDVEPITDAVKKILSLNGITYRPNELAETFGFNTATRVVGLFADEVQAVLPEAVKNAPFDAGPDTTSVSGENYKTVQYEKVIPLLVEAIKEQQNQIDNQAQLINQLLDKVNTLVNK